MLSFPTWLAYLGLASHLVGTVRGQTANVGDIFEIDFSTDQDGGCRGIGEAAIQGLLDEAAQLASAGLRLVDDAGTNPTLDATPAGRLLEAYFNGAHSSVAQRTAIRVARPKPNAFPLTVSGFLANYRQVQGFLEGQITLAGGKPYFFCDHTWITAQASNDAALDANGRTYTDNNGNLVTVATHRVLSQHIRRGSVAYFSHRHNAYHIDALYPVVPGRPMGQCNDPGILGETVTWDVVHPNRILRRVLVLCPGSFTGRRLGSTALNPVTVAQYRQNPQMAALTGIDRIALEEVSTLYHELFHLVLGNAESLPTGGEEYDPTVITGLAPAVNVRNPESYTLPALAYWYTERDISTGTNPPIEFFVGVATRG